MCKTALEQSDEGRAIAKSFDYGILFLMGIPYVMAGTLAFVAFRAYRRAVRKLAEANVVPSFEEGRPVECSEARGEV